MVEPSRSLINHSDHGKKVAALISAKQLAELTNEMYHTIDYWTDMKLLSVKRRKGRNRYYEKDSSIETCRKIRELQNEGYSIDLIFRNFAKASQQS